MIHAIFLGTNFDRTCSILFRAISLLALKQIHADSRGVFRAVAARRVYSPRVEQHPASFTADNVPPLSLSLFQM